ncbi:hypothetical protein DV735_g4680, partial [Chaetothyriales sp. CBS 134920]
MDRSESRTTGDLSRADSSASCRTAPAGTRCGHVHFARTAQLRRPRSVLHTGTPHLSAALRAQPQTRVATLHAEAGFVDRGRTPENYGAEPSSYRRIRRTRSILTPRGRLFSDSRSPQPTPFSQAPTLRNSPKESAVSEHGLRLRLKRSINALRPTSRLSITRRPETHLINHEVAVELAREQYFAGVREELIHSPGLISNPKAARLKQPFPKSVRSQQAKETETEDNYYQRAQASVDELAVTIEATSGDVGLSEPHPLKQSASDESRRRPPLAEETKTKDQMRTLGTTGSNTKHHRRERAQIDPEEVEVGIVKSGKNNRFPMLEVKEVVRANTPAPQQSGSNVSKNRTGLLKRISSLDLGSVIGKSEESRKASAGGRKYSPGNIARILRERRSQVLTAGGEGRDKENNGGIGEESPPVSTPGRLQLQMRNGNGRLRKRRSEMTVTMDHATPKSVNVSPEAKDGEVEESPTERVKQKQTI